MVSIKRVLLVPAAILAVACGRDDSSKSVDDALNADLTLAAQARPYMAMDSVSAAERAYAAQGFAPLGYAAPAAYAPPVRERIVYRDRPVARRSTSRSSGSSRSSGTYSAPAPRRQTVTKHVKRDAAIGAAAGAVIGATTSRDKVKGAVIGGVAGAVLGGVIGNNVDVQRR
ncbi:MAG: glycine zipper 2TM domain-containing protein [Gemmatimonadaceae bacterium]|nr:glycine zipper 2TM domain-containing protein [Gemmatimonadaceae bacterium]